MRAPKKDRRRRKDPREMGAATGACRASRNGSSGGLYFLRGCAKLPAAGPPFLLRTTVNQHSALLVSVVAVPVAGVFILPLAGRVSATFRNLLAFACGLWAFLGSCCLLPVAAAGGQTVSRAGLCFGFDVALTADALAVFMALVSSSLSTLIILFSFDYISHYDNQNEYYAMVSLFLGAMMGLVFSSNLVLLYIFWEITAITSWRLIGFFRSADDVVRADKSFLVTVFGAVLMLAGFVSLAQTAGTWDLARLRDAFFAKPLPPLAVVLILSGILSKSATLPFHTWLPDAGVAPSPVTALLHAAVLVKIGVYVFARLFVATVPLDGSWRIAVGAVAAASALISAGAALRENNLKRLIAFSTISQIGFIFFALSLDTELGLVAGLLYILMHGLAKAGLFLCAGILEQATGTRDIRQMGGLAAGMPVTMTAFLLCAFSVMGVPPFGGFFSKTALFVGAIEQGSVALAGVFLVGSFLTVLYLLRAATLVFFGPARDRAVREGSPLMVATVALLALLSLGAGVFISYPVSFAGAAARQMLGVGP